jgi:hypothetical protein
MSDYLSRDDQIQGEITLDDLLGVGRGAYAATEGLPGELQQLLNAIAGADVFGKGLENTEQRAKARGIDLEKPGESVGQYMDFTGPLGKLVGAMAVAPAIVKGAKGSESLFDLSRLGREQPALRKEIDYYTPPRGAPAHLQELAENEDAYQQVLEWTKQGLTDEGVGWYDTVGLRDKFIERYGEKEGARRMKLYMDMVASTSTGARVPANIKIASHYYQQALKGEPLSIPEKGSGYGHLMQQSHKQGADKVVEGEGLSPSLNPKRATFSENLQGNWAESTVDKHNVRAWGYASRNPKFLKTQIGKDVNKTPPEFWDEKKFGKWEADPKFRPQDFVAENYDQVDWDKIPPGWLKEAPSKNEYRAYNEMNKRLAKDLGISPAQAQAALWLGAGERTGLGSPPKAFMELFQERIMATADKLDISPEEALNKFMAGDERLRAMLIPALVGSGAAGVYQGGQPDAEQY